MSQLNLINYWKNKKQPVFNNLQCKLCNNVDYKNNYKIFKASDMFHAENFTVINVQNAMLYLEIYVF